MPFKLVRGYDLIQQFHRHNRFCCSHEALPPVTSIQDGRRPAEKGANLRANMPLRWALGSSQLRQEVRGNGAGARRVVDFQRPSGSFRSLSSRRSHPTQRTNTAKMSHAFAVAACHLSSLPHRIYTMLKVERNPISMSSPPSNGEKHAAVES